MLTLVHPARDGQDPSPRRRKGLRPASLSLTPDEARHLRASIRNIARTRYGTLRKLAAALGVEHHVLTKKRRPSPALAVALWRLTGVPVESLLAPQLAAVPSPGGAP